MVLLFAKTDKPDIYCTSNENKLKTKNKTVEYSEWKNVLY